MYVIRPFKILIMKMNNIVIIQFELSTNNQNSNINLFYMGFTKYCHTL